MTISSVKVMFRVIMSHFLEAWQTFQSETNAYHVEFANI